MPAVYSRTLNGQTLTLLPSGWTYHSIFVLLDSQTETLWFPEDEGLTGIQGPHADESLPRRPFTDTTWKEWQAEHPASLILY